MLVVKAMERKLKFAKSLLRKIIRSSDDEASVVSPQLPIISREQTLVDEKVFRFNTPPQIALKQTFLKRGYLVTRTVNEYTLSRFLEKLHPVNIEEGLIRVGGKGDGGYLLPNNLENISACFSPGVAANADFEKELYESNNIKAFMADYSVDKSPVEGKGFHFTKKFLGRTNDDVNMRLQDWVESHADEGKDLLLQMDIEGAEYGVLLDTPKSTLRKFRVMVVEFHSLDQLFGSDSFQWIEAVFDHVLEDFTVVHIHPNNCCPTWKLGEIEIPTVLEITLYRSDQVVETGEPVIYPHALDETNVPKKQDIHLSQCWGVARRSD
jgi:FkbM family methyltransferase